MAPPRCKIPSKIAWNLLFCSEKFRIQKNHCGIYLLGIRVCKHENDKDSGTKNDAFYAGRKVSDGKGGTALQISLIVQQRLVAGMVGDLLFSLAPIFAI